MNLFSHNHWNFEWGISETFTKVLSFLSVFSWMNEPEPEAVPFCLDLLWWGVKEGIRPYLYKKKNFLFSIISMKLECEAYLNIHMMLSVVCGLTILIIISINIKQLIRTVYRLQEPCTFMNATKHQYCDRAEQQVMNTNPFPTAAACFSLFEKSYFRNFTKFYSK